MDDDYFLNNYDFVSLEEIRDRFAKDGAKGIQDFNKEKQDALRAVPLNIAVIGHSGVGKSTFINAIRGLKSKDPGWAATGCVETTKVVTAYPQPGNEALQFWDLPGVGTENFPQDRYLELVEFGRYDFFLILSAVRFTGMDMWLGLEILKSKRKFFFVRTKIFLDVINDKFTYPDEHNEEQLLLTIRTDIEDHLRKNAAMAPIFLIDSLRPRQFDFDELAVKLVQDFPDLKRDALTLAINNLSEKMIREKIKVLRREVLPLAFAAAAANAVPVPFSSVATDAGIIAAAISRFLTALGLDDTSLQVTSQRTGISLLQLRTKVQEFFPSSVITVNGITGLG
ncbi:interferon-inducible GTPase 5-like [Paramacrobiotus metropolitanus]|uniref:interferon-inducible GTPase 5-like n=1 Tax=Paramacrobiotus metropolitanus TaxID=2943436 RepID=UPI0024455EE6|nr:interferon-inducible GTPase 5-like [Paramacrobiotus metropolitanus]